MIELFDVDPFETNCKNCAGFCCVTPEFLPEEGFPKHKEQDIICEHASLKECGRRLVCGIYGNRTEKGYTGCGEFDCGGAGTIIADVFSEDLLDFFRGKVVYRRIGTFFALFKKALDRLKVIKRLGEHYDNDQILEKCENLVRVFKLFASSIKTSNATVASVSFFLDRTIAGVDQYIKDETGFNVVCLSKNMEEGGTRNLEEFRSN